MSRNAFPGNQNTSNFKIFSANPTMVRLPERGGEGRGKVEGRGGEGAENPQSDRVEILVHGRVDAVGSP